jgi:hypothetical protein
MCFFNEKNLSTQKNLLFFYSKGETKVTSVEKPYCTFSKSQLNFKRQERSCLCMQQSALPFSSCIVGCL